MSSGEKPDIPTMVKDFMARPIWEEKPVRAWLYLALPELMEKAQQGATHQFHARLEELAQKTGDASLKTLRIDDGSFDQVLEQLRREYSTVPTEAGNNLIDKIERRKTVAQNAQMELLFLKDELLPTLKELEEGGMPTRKHLSVLEVASGNNKELHIFGAIPSYYNSDTSSLLADDSTDLHIHERDTKFIEKFFGDLYRKVKTAVQTGRGEDFGKRIARNA